MKKHDRDNLNFLLAATPEVLEDWYEQMEEDDIEYAFELLEAYQTELEDKKQAMLLLDRGDVFVVPNTNTIH
jgi:hypothetical protein